jgi:hypothetical protein
MRILKRILKNIITLIAYKFKRKAPKYLASYRLKKGHTLYEVDTETGEIRKAAFEEGEVSRASIKNGLQSKRSKRILNKENCIYVAALNERNVAKILERRVEEARRIVESQLC